MSSKKFDVQWHDEDDNHDFEGGDAQQSAEESNEFLQLLGQSQKFGAAKTPVVGDKIEAVISLVSEQSSDVMLDLGGKTSAVISKQELCTPEGTFPYQVGDKISAFVVSTVNGEVILSNSMSHSVAKKQALETAYTSQLPVRGRVAAVQKGGWQIYLLGRSAFCPVSQMDLRYVAQPEEFVGKEFDFLIQKFGGRDLVVSRAALLRRQGAETLARIKSKLAENPILEGVVVEVKDFAAMVDVGGLIGMIHISEISHGHLRNAGEALAVGARVTVKVLQLTEEEGKHPRLSLSLKALQQDPWEQAMNEFRVGENYQGRVVRLADFGAFVELKPGLDGLIHLSEMSWQKRVRHPRELLQEGQQVTVNLLDLNPLQKRISLSLKSPDEDPWFAAETKFKPGTLLTGTVESLKPFGALMALDETSFGVKGLVPISFLRLAFGDSYRKKAAPGQALELKVLHLDTAEHKILLTLADLAAQDESVADYQAYLQAAANTQPATSGEKSEAQGSLGAALQEKLRQQKEKKSPTN